jgi:hypothetical protein
VRLAGACAVALLAPLALSACESTADKSARIAREGKEAVKAAGRLDVTHPNAEVRVTRAVVVRGDGGAVAAAVELRNAGARAQANVPLLIDVHDAKGASVYRNDTIGLQPALQRVALVRGGGSAWWVNDQVTATDPPRTITAKVGAAKAVAAAPSVTLRDVHFDGDDTGRYLTGTVVNGSKAVQQQLPIFAVALKGRRVVAAGRALVPKLPAAGAPGKPVTFRLFFVGDPRGARIALTVAPTAVSLRSPP